MVNEVKSESEFNSVISSGKIVVVDFYASWCGPCRFIAPKVDELSKKYEGKGVVFVKVDVDALPTVASQCGISAMPTFQIFKDGQKVTEVMGADANALERAVAGVLA